MFQRHHGVVLLLSGILLAVVALVPLAVRSAIQELGVERPEATTDWQVIEAEGLRFRVPANWFTVTSAGGILGVDSGEVVAPACTEQADAGCRSEDGPPLALRWQIERVENRSTGEGDEIRALYEERGFPQQEVTLRSLPATLFTASEEFGGVDQIVILEHSGVYYRIWLSEGLATSSTDELGALILGTIEFTPETAPEPWLPDDPGIDNPTFTTDLYLPLISSAQGAPQLRATSQQIIPMQGTPSLAEAVFINPEAVAAYADLYAAEPWPGGKKNSDDCYVYTNGDNTSARCEKDLVHTIGRDGAHFIDCALKAGGLDLACNGDPTHPFVSMQSLYTHLLGLSHQVVPSNEARRGDIFVLIDRGINRACWGGIILGRNSDTTLFAATHSTDGRTTNPDAQRCIRNNVLVPVDIVYLRFNADDAPPEAVFLAPVAGRMPPGDLTLAFDATDLPVEQSSGVASFQVARTLEGGAREVLVESTPERALALFADTPCRNVTFHLTATDNAGNRSPEVNLDLSIGIWGDADGNNVIDAADLAAAEAAWGAQRGEPGYIQALDVNADDRIDATDLLWIERHRGDRCE